VTLIKASSLVSAIGVSDLMWQANDLASTTFRPFEVITFVAAVYCALTLPLTILANVIHRRLTGQRGLSLTARGRATLAGLRLRGDLMAP
jgi:ABC-type amino acid transport system permease subunit